MDKRTNHWDGIIDVETLKSFTCRIWSKKDFPIAWSGENIELLNYDQSTGMMSAHVGGKTYVFHLSSVIIQVQDSKSDVVKESDEDSVQDEDTKEYAEKIHKSSSKKRKCHHK